MNGYSYTCGCCGAELVLNNENQMITKCLYCGNSIAITKKEYSEMNIKKIIPFSLDRDDVIRKYGNKIFNKVVDAKKVYVPVKYCSFDFDYLIYYEYVIRDDDGNRYVNEEELFDGRVEKKIAFGTSKIDSVEEVYLMDIDSRLDFDPVLLKDVSIECSHFDDEEQIKKKLEENIADYFRKRTAFSIYTLFSENYFITDLEIEPFTTLIPVYILKTKNGTIKKVPGVPVKTKNGRRIARYILTFIIISLAMVLSINIYRVFSGYGIYNPKSLYNACFFIVIIVILTLIIMIMIGILPKSKKKISFEDDCYKFKRYRMGDKRSRLNLKRR